MSSPKLPHPVDEPAHFLISLMQIPYDESAWHNFRGAVYALFCRLLARSSYIRDPIEEAEDLTQELVIKVFKLLHLEPIPQAAVRAPLSFAHRVAQNDFLNYIRYRRIRVEKTPQPEDTDTIDEIEIIDTRQFLDKVFNDWVRQRHPGEDKRSIIKLLREGKEADEIIKLLKTDGSRVYNTRTEFIKHARVFAGSEGL